MPTDGKMNLAASESMLVIHFYRTQTVELRFILFYLPLHNCMTASSELTAPPDHTPKAPYLSSQSEDSGCSAFRAGHSSSPVLQGIMCAQRTAQGAERLWVGA